MNDTLTVSEIDLADLFHKQFMTFCGPMNEHIKAIEKQNNVSLQFRKQCLHTQGQVDLPKKVSSGLIHAVTLLSGIRGIKINPFNANDCVRHPLLKRTIKAYESI